MPRFSIRAMKSPAVKRASAERQKSGFCDRKFAGPASRLVKLQRPPPEMRIRSPIFATCSISRTRRPRRPASAAHIMPAAPAPTTTTSKRMSLCDLAHELPVAWHRTWSTLHPCHLHEDPTVPLYVVQMFYSSLKDSNHLVAEAKNTVSALSKNDFTLMGFGDHTSAIAF